MRALLAIAATLWAAPHAAAQQMLPPPYQGVYQPQGVDEIGLWREDDEAEKELAASPLVIRDEALTAYVKHVLCETVGDDRCNSVRVYIIREPTFNASMSPNGTMRVLSGLFLRVRNEAELGAVLGHEFGHFESRHTLQAFRSRRTGSDVLAWGALLAGMAPGYRTMRTYQDLQLSVYGSLFRHSRDQEREADRLGVAYLNRSALRPQAAGDMWQHVMAEAESSASVRGLKKPNFNAIAFTASHPPNGERAAYLTELAASDGDARDDGAARYREALATWMPVFLDDQIKLNDFGASDYLIQNLAQNGWTDTLWLARGNLYRTRGTQRDFIAAAQFYQNALALNPALGEAYRGLGLSLIKTARRTEGQAALKHYLQLSPDASDAAMIRLMLPEENSQ
ncbi:putative Zn-dependent protease [Stakelama pacifica]|uniref:Putative Zn-dependent protease n=2 Tax=Stakelama pacifica TaxID=517720 RepID=A0A4V3BSI6_9SPHN|nr:putative Zn-dependent protease [Stakelama pacifica]